MDNTQNIPRRHHYVPRVYHQNFSKKESNEWIITVLDKTKSEPYKTNIKNVAVEKDFYRVKEYVDKFYWEHYYMSIPRFTASTAKVCLQT